MSNRLIGVIVIFSFVFLLGINFVLFTIIQPNTFVHNYTDTGFNFLYMQNYHYEYKGFQYFFEYISTFPGLINSHNTVNHVAAVLSREITYTGYTVVDAMIGVLDIMSSPVQLIITFVLDVINNVIWIFELFIPHYFS